MRVVINNKEYSNFSSYNINLAYNSIASSFTITGLNHVILNPLSYPEIKIYDESNDLIITGRIVTPEYSDFASVNQITYSGYSLPGVLEDCNIPIELYPLQSDNLSLKQICDKLFTSFGISYVIDSIVSDEMNKKYTKSIAGEGQSIKDYINALASQRGVIMTHDRNGNVVFTRLNIANLKPVYYFENESTVEMSLSFDGQAMHSEITIIRQASTDNPDAGQFTITNPYVDSYRPKVKVMSSGDIFDVRKASRQELSNELSTIKLNIKTKKYIKPGSIIQAKSERLLINKPTSFFVESTNIQGDVNGEKYTLVCSLPDVYSDNEVKSIFV